MSHEIGYCTDGGELERVGGRPGVSGLLVENRKRFFQTIPVQEYKYKGLSYQ